MLTASVPTELSGQRLDVIAAQLFPDYSRERLKAWIKNGDLRVDDRSVKANAKMLGGESLVLQAEDSPQGDWVAQDIALELVYEDEHLLVLNKPAGLVVHPAAGNYDGTLLNGLLHRWPGQIAIPRAGIVHRLDKDTTGLMAVAKTLKAQADLVHQLQSRTVKRQYQALVLGKPPSRGEVDAAIARDPNHRKRMAVVAGGKPALTEFRKLRQLGPLAFMELNLRTGRTHQIRVHMTHIGFPLLGDPVYGRRALARESASAEALQRAGALERQALHAQMLSLKHPQTGEQLQWQAPLPADMAEILEAFGFDL